MKANNLIDSVNFMHGVLSFLQHAPHCKVKGWNCILSFQCTCIIGAIFSTTITCFIFLEINCSYCLDYNAHMAFLMRNLHVSFAILWGNLMRVH